MTCAMLLARASTVHAAATWCIEHQPWDFAAVLYDGIELFCRQFANYQFGGFATSEEDVEMYQHVVPAAYRFHDMMLGRLLELAGHETTVLLVSDHGYRADQFRSADAIDDGVVHRPPGLWAMCGPGVKRGAGVHGASVLDVAPTVLRLMGQPVGADMDGRAWSEVIDRGPAKEAHGSIGSWEDAPGEAGLHPPGPSTGAESLGSVQHLLELGYAEPRDGWKLEAVHQTREQNQHNLARVLLEAGQPAQAAALLERTHKRLPGNVAVAQTLFEASLALENFRAARALAESALAHGVDPALGHLALAAVDLAMRNPTAALEHLETAEQLGGQTARLQILIGQGYRRLRYWDDAQRAFSKATMFDDDDAAGWHGMATAMLARGRNDAAAKLALRALELRPDYPEAHYHLGVALMGLGRAEEAAVALKRCLAVSPNMLPAYRRLVELYQGPLRDEALTRAYRQEARVLILQRRLRRRSSAPPPWQAPAPSEPGTP
jgi:tetratricopeptide (TPR) repeat protein